MPISSISMFLISDKKNDETVATVSSLSRSYNSAPTCTYRLHRCGSNRARVRLTESFIGLHHSFRKCDAAMSGRPVISGKKRQVGRFSSKARSRRSRIDSRSRIRFYILVFQNIARKQCAMIRARLDRKLRIAE